MTRRLEAAWLVPALAVLATCGLWGLFEPTETRYAEIAREMLRSGDWLVPRLNGIAHFHKPPLAYWGAAAGMALTGVNEWGARLATALAAGYVFWASSRIARHLGGGGAALAPVVLGSMFLFAALSRQLSSDAPLAACAAWFWVSYLGARERPAGGRVPLGLYAALAAGFMAKGPIIFLHTLLPLFGVGMLMRGHGVWAPLRSGRGWALAALAALPWYVIVVARHEGLAGYFLQNQILERYMTTVHGRPGPWYYFAAVLLAGAMPWTIVLLGEIVRRAREWARERSFESAALLSWVVLPTVFFSTSGSKLPAYVLPEAIPVAILAASSLAGFPRSARFATAVPMAGLAIALEGFGPRGLAKMLHAGIAPTLALPPAAHAAAAAWVLGAFAFAWGRPRAGAWCAWGALVAALFAVAPLDGPLGSPRHVAALVERARGADEPLVEYGDFNAGLLFYLDTKAVLVEVPRDLRFEVEEPHPAVGRAPDIAALAREHGRVWLYAKRGAAASLAASLGLAEEPVALWRGREMTALRPME